MTIADSIERMVKYVLSNLETLTVSRIRSRARQNLTLENGAGASIKLDGSTVYINGVAVNGTGIGIGDLNITDSLWALPTPVDIAFANSGWGQYFGMFWTGDGTSYAPPGMYLHAYQAAKTTLVASDKELATDTLARVFSNSALSGIHLHGGDDYALDNGFLLEIVDVNEAGTEVEVNLRDNGTIVATWVVTENSGWAYLQTYDAVSGVPMIVVRFGTIFVGPETWTIDLTHVFQIDTPYNVATYTSDIVLSELGAYLILENDVDMRLQDIKRTGSIIFGDNILDKIYGSSPNIIHNVATGIHDFQVGGVSKLQVQAAEVHIDTVVDMNSHTIAGLPTPVNSDEAATKNYVDLQTGGGSGSLVTTEFIQDVIGSTLVNGDDSITVTYDDANNRVLLYATAGSGGAEVTGTPSNYFMIDNDNISGVSGAAKLYFNRGAVDKYGGWQWMEDGIALDHFMQATRVDGETPYPCSVAVNKIYFGASHEWSIGVDYDTGNLVIHGPSGKGIKFDTSLGD